jgi:hypothetical protein
MEAAFPPGHTANPTPSSSIPPPTTPPTHRQVVAQVLHAEHEAALGVQQVHAQRADEDLRLAGGGRGAGEEGVGEGIRRLGAHTRGLRLKSMLARERLACRGAQRGNLLQFKRGAPRT